MFDPYHDWLDIPPEQQPPSHYQILGIAPDEVNPEAIKEAALRQTTRVRVYQTGPQSALCTRILNEIAQARAILQNPKTREEYDARRAASSAPPPSAPRPTAPPPTNAAAIPWPRPDRVLAALGYCLLLVCGFAISFCLTFQSLRTAAHAPGTEDKAAPSVEDAAP
jgi:hypothetical protein